MFAQVLLELKQQIVQDSIHVDAISLGETHTLLNFHVFKSTLKTLPEYKHKPPVQQQLQDVV